MSGYASSYYGGGSNSSVVATTGVINGPLVIGDDYLRANGRGLEWSVAEISGAVAADCSAVLEFFHPRRGSASISGTCVDNGDDTWSVRFDVLGTDTASFIEAMYEWSAYVVTAAGAKVTIKYGEDCNRVKFIQGGT